jgi:hypothetical protein
MGEAGPCQAIYMSCDPHAWAWLSQFATCLLPKCQSSSDCAMLTAQPALECTGDADCLATPGAYCSDDDVCVFDASCDYASGRCAWEGFGSDAEIGSPCETVADCGANMICMREDVDEDGKVAPRAGFCTRRGCKAANEGSPNGSGSSDPAIQSEFSCGDGVCHAGFKHGGMCFKSCVPTGGSCRQDLWDAVVEDQAGDYDCYESGEYGFNIAESGDFYLLADGPYCSFVARGADVKCGDDGMTPDQCETYFGGNPTPWELGMTCRNHETGEPDTDGYCLDQTTSGETGDWDTDSDT